MAKNKPTASNIRQGQTIYSVARHLGHRVVLQHHIIHETASLLCSGKHDLRVSDAVFLLKHKPLPWYQTRGRAERALKRAIYIEDKEPTGMVHQDPFVCCECNMTIVGVVILCRECSSPIHMDCMDMDMQLNRLCSKCF